jgi:hypothetical protein
MTEERLNNIHPVHLLIVFLLPVLVFIPTLFNGLVYDDYPQVINNPWIRDPSNLAQIFTSSNWAFKGEESNIYRPLFHLVLTIEYQLFELKAWGYHLVNIVFHGANTLLLFLLSLRLLNSPGAGGIANRGQLLTAAYICALIFAFHPVNVEPVAWVSSIPELFYTFFSLLSILTFVRASQSERDRDTVLRVVSILSFWAALLFKEPAVFIIVLIWLYDLVVRKSPFVDTIKRIVPYMLVVVLYAVFRSIVIGGLIHHKQIDLSSAEVILNAMPLFAAYLGKLLLPLKLNVLYELDLVKSITEARALASIVVTAFFVVILYLSRKRGEVFLFLVWIAVPLLPVLYLPGLATASFAERYLYLPSAGYALLIAYIFVNIRIQKRPLLLILALYLAFFLVSTLTREPVWKNEVTLWEDAVVKSQENPYVRYNLAWAYHDQGLLDEAMREYGEALRINPRYSEARYQRGVLFARKGMGPQAERELVILINTDPAFPGAREMLGLVREQFGLR